MRRSTLLKVVFLIVVIAASFVAVYIRLQSLLPYAYIKSYPLKASIELDKSAYAFNENITITCILRNIGNKTIKLLFSEQMGYLDDELKWHTAYFSFIVSDENGTMVYD